MKFYQKPWFTVLTLILFFPLGLFLMWKHNHFNKVARVLISVFFGIIVLFNVIGDDSTTTSNLNETKKTLTAVEFEQMYLEPDKFKGSKVDFNAQIVLMLPEQDGYLQMYVNDKNDKMFLLGVKKSNIVLKEENNLHIVGTVIGSTKEKDKLTPIVKADTVEITGKDDSHQNESKVENNPSDTVADNEQAPKEKEKPTRDNSSAKLTTLNAGKFNVGKDIPEGRYVITGNSQGNLFVKENEVPIVNEILGSANGMGVASVTTDLKDGQEIEINGISKVKFTPASTKVSNILTTGTWVVGIDIEPGRYDAAAKKGQGNFFVYRYGMPVVNEILGAANGMGVDKVTVDLEKDDVVSISSINKVVFTKR